MIGDVAFTLLLWLSQKSDYLQLVKGPVLTKAEIGPSLRKERSLTLDLINS